MIALERTNDYPQLELVAEPSIHPWQPWYRRNPGIFVYDSVRIDRGLGIGSGLTRAPLRPGASSRAITFLQVPSGVPRFRAWRLSGTMDVQKANMIDLEAK